MLIFVRLGFAKPLMNSSMSENMLKTFVFAKILKSHWNNAKQPNIYFYKDTNQKEIDFVIEKMVHYIQ